MFTKLKTAEKWLGKLLSQPGKWKGMVQQENGHTMASIWMPFGENLGYHVVLQMLEKPKPIQFMLAEHPYCMRVAKGIVQVKLGIELNYSPGRGQVKYKVDEVMESVFSAGSIYMSKDEDAWEHITPLTEQAWLTRVNKACSEAPYMEGEHLSQKHLDWMLQQFKALYGV